MNLFIRFCFWNCNRKHYNHLSMTRELSQRAAGSSKAIISEYIAELHYPSDLHDVRVAQ
jgi:hypothetical protein